MIDNISIIPVLILERKNNIMIRLTKMVFDVKYDGKIQTGNDYTMPGGYQLQSNDGKIYPFDFYQSASYSVGNCDDTMHYECSDLMIEEFPESENLPDDIFDTGKFLEFFIYMDKIQNDDNDDAELINPIEVKGLTIEYANEAGDIVIVEANENLVKSATESLSSNY